MVDGGGAARRGGIATIMQSGAKARYVAHFSHHPAGAADATCKMVRFDVVRDPEAGTCRYEVQAAGYQAAACREVAHQWAAKTAFVALCDTGSPSCAGYGIKRLTYSHCGGSRSRAGQPALTWPYPGFGATVSGSASVVGAAPAYKQA